MSPASFTRRRLLASASLALAGCALRTGLPLPSAPLDGAAWRAARRWVATPSGRVALVERGAGPAALFLHGFPLSGFQWRGALERLADARRCLAPDLLGLGESEPAPGQRLAPGDQATMLLQLLDALGLGAVDVVASDSGGAVAQLLVARAPARVRTLLLTNCDTEPDCPPPALRPVLELARQGRYAEAWLEPWAASPAKARSAEGLGGMTYSRPGFPTDDGVALYLEPLVRTAAARRRVEAYALALEANALEGLAPALRRQRLPVRVLWGLADDVFSPLSPGYLDRLFPGSRGVRRLEGRKLFFPEEEPDLVALEARALWGVA